MELVKRTGYADIVYKGVQRIPELLGVHRERGLTVLGGTHTGTDVSKEKPGFEPGLPEAIEQVAARVESGPLPASRVSRGTNRGCAAMP